MLAYHFSRGLQETSYAHRSVLDCSLQLLTTSSCPPSIASTGCSTDHGTQYAPHFVMSWLDSQYKNTWLIRMLNCFFFFLFPGCLGGMIPATDRITNERQSNVIISQSLKFITVCWLPTVLLIAGVLPPLSAWSYDLPQHAQTTHLGWAELG